MQEKGRAPVLWLRGTCWDTQMWWALLPFPLPHTFSWCPNFKTPQREEGTKVSWLFFVFNYFPF